MAAFGHIDGISLTSQPYGSWVYYELVDLELMDSGSGSYFFFFFVFRATEL